MDVFYDGACPLCMREIKMIMKWDRNQQINFIDIAAPSFSPSTYGKTMKWFEISMRSRISGEWISGVESFRQMYHRVGFRKTVAFSRFPIISQLLAIGYWAFAKIRPHLPGRKECQQCTISVAENADTATNQN